MATRSESLIPPPPSHTSAFNGCLRTALSLGGYVLLVACAACFFIVDARTPAEIRFSESGCVETAQLAMLALAMLAFACGIRSNTQRRTLGIVFYGLFMLAYIRELDWLLDKVVHGFWKAPAAAVAGAAAWGVWRRRQHLLPALADLFERPAWGLLSGGFLTVTVFSRLIGLKANWVAMLGRGALTTSIKRAAEEGVELLGYTLIACGAWAYMIEGLKSSQNTGVNRLNRTASDLPDVDPSADGSP